MRARAGPAGAEPLAEGLRDIRRLVDPLQRVREVLADHQVRWKRAAQRRSLREAAGEAVGGDRVSGEAPGDFAFGEGGERVECAQTQPLQQPDELAALVTRLIQLRDRQGRQEARRLAGRDEGRAAGGAGRGERGGTAGAAPPRRPRLVTP
jgi:hypothetical protein